MQVNAGHSSCDGALAQEAELVDALQRIQRFQLVGNTLYLLDQSGQRLIQAQRNKRWFYHLFIFIELLTSWLEYL